jgi:hypothetical protein
MNTRYTRNHYIITAIFMQFAALAYLYVMDVRVITPAKLVWASDYGLILFIPMLLLTAYAWFLIGLAILADDATFNVLNSVSTNSNLAIYRVTENDGDWKAKAVHWTDTHTTTSVHWTDKFPTL